VWQSPWCKLQRFHRVDEDGKARPKVLLVAPLSGHYATLLRGTVRGFLQDHDVYVTEWSNARDVPIYEGRFDFHDFVDHVRAMLAEIGPSAHVVAVCQPGPPALAAASLMAEDKDPNRPASMVFMGSPIDARLSPTVTNKMAEDRPFTWFQSYMIHTVPAPYLGVNRRVYPGFVQLYSFMSMNEKLHMDAHWRYFEDLMRDDGDSAAKHEGRADPSRPPGGPGRDHRHRPDDGGGSPRRHLGGRPDPGGPRPVPQHPRGDEGALCPSGRRALWRVQRLQVPPRHLPAHPRLHPQGRPRVGARRCVIALSA
jgi:hypothetical protein